MAARQIGELASVPIADIVLDNTMQMRVEGLNEGHIEDLLEILKAHRFPPRVQLRRVQHVGLILTDGFHTLEAYRRAGKQQIPANIRPGTAKEAVLDAAAANQHPKSPLKRTNADKRRAVEAVLGVMGKEWSDRKIAEHVGVNHSLVSSIRNDKSRHSDEPLLDFQPEDNGPTIRTGRDGRQFKPKHQAPPTVLVQPDLEEPPRCVSE